MLAPGGCWMLMSVRIAMGVGGEVIGAPMSPQDIVDDVVRAEADGFGSAWSVHFSRGVDALDVLAVAGARTSRIDLGVGIVPTYPRHPLALAQQAATTQAFCGRLLTPGWGRTPSGHPGMILAWAVMVCGCASAPIPVSSAPG